MSESVLQQLNDLFATQLNLHVPSFETDLIDEGLLDSLVFVDLIMQLELQFGIEIAVETLDVNEFRSLWKIAALVKTLQPVPTVSLT